MPEADRRQHDGHTATPTMAVVAEAAITVIARRRDIVSGAAIVMVADARAVMSMAVAAVMAPEIMVPPVVVLVAMVTVAAVPTPVVAVSHGDSAEGQCKRSKYRTEGFHGSYSW